MFYFQIFLVVITAIMGIANLVAVAVYVRRYPMTLVINGVAAMICFMSSLFNLAQIIPH